MSTPDTDSESWFQQLNPLRDGTPDEARSGRLVVLLSLIVAGAAMTYEILYVIMQMWLPVVAVGLTIALAIGIALGFKYRPNVPAAAHALAGAAFIALFGVTWATGGLQSVAIAWFLVVPMLGALLNGRRTGLVWAGVTLTWMTVLYGLHLTGYETPNGMPVAFRSLFDYAAPAGLIACAFSFVWSYELSREEAMEKLCEARDEATRAHKHARAVLDNVGEGLVLVRGDGSLQPARSAALERWFGAPADDANVWDVLRTQDNRLADMVEVGWDQVTSGWLPVEVALDQLPTRLETDGQVLQLQWSPAGDDGEVMFVATDVTAQMQAEEERREQEELVNILARIGRSRQQVQDFAADARRIVDALQSREGTAVQERRWIHTLKGNSAVMGLGRLARSLHVLETRVEDERREPNAAERAELDEQWTRIESRISEIVGTEEENTIRVPAAELDNTIHLVVSGESRDQVAAKMESWTWDDAGNRMGHLGDQAKRLAQQLDKSIEVSVESEGVRTPPTQAWRELWTSMVHLVRNAVDHGLEQDRGAAGKSGPGKLTLLAERVAQTVQLEVRDDGAGIDWGKLEAKAREQGRTLTTDTERVAWLFSDGVTSRDEVSELSGRGVGTSAVLELVTSLGGTIHIDTELGQFTRFVLALPLQSEQSAANTVGTAQSA
ncbi:MAG: ATP-binding protein [Nannocystales bacterium]